MITMLMVVTENGWSNIQYNYAEKFGSPTEASIFFNSFYLLVKFIILSLLTGLIWEIFTIISSNLTEDEEEPEMTSIYITKTEDVSHSGEESQAQKDIEPVEVMDPGKLAYYKDENLTFFRKKMKETKKAEDKNPVEMMRDDYSFDNVQSGVFDQLDSKKEEITTVEYEYKTNCRLNKKKEKGGKANPSERPSVFRKHYGETVLEREDDSPLDRSLASKKDEVIESVAVQINLQGERVPTPIKSVQFKDSSKDKNKSTQPRVFAFEETPIVVVNKTKKQKQSPILVRYINERITIRSFLNIKPRPPMWSGSEARTVLLILSNQN